MEILKEKNAGTVIWTHNHLTQLLGLPPIVKKKGPEMKERVKMQKCSIVSILIYHLSCEIL